MTDEQFLPADEREIRASLGLETAYGYHVEPRAAWGDDPRLADILAALEAGRAPDAPIDRAPLASLPSSQDSAHAPSPYPCLTGVRYSGCLGDACPLQTCWTGAPTPASLARGRARWVGAASYLADTLCHRCRHVAAATPPASGADAPQDATGAPVEAPDTETGAIPRGPSRRVTCGTLICARGRWRYAASRHDFASRRIPIKDDVDPAACPSFEDAGALHPEVVAYRARRRQSVREHRERLKRAEQARGDEEAAPASHNDARPPHPTARSQETNHANRTAPIKR